MRKISSLRQTIQSTSSTRDGWELYATADVKYDPATSTVFVELDSIVQHGGSAPGVDGFRQPWLPAKEIVTRRVPLSEARDVAREVFRRWTGKVRRTIPTPTHHVVD